MPGGSQRAPPATSPVVYTSPWGSTILVRWAEKNRGRVSFRLAGSGKSHAMTGSSSKARARALASAATSARSAFLMAGSVTPKYGQVAGAFAAPSGPGWPESHRLPVPAARP